MSEKKSRFVQIDIALLEMGMGYAQFAESLGMSYQAVLRRMNGDVEWDLSEIIKVSQLLGKDAHYLFGIDLV